MDWQKLQQRIARWEDLHTEFKEWPVHNDVLTASLVAFANTDGGQLILGVDKTRHVVGIDDTDAAMQRIDQIAYNNCEPPLTVVQETVVTDSGVVVVVNVPKGDQRPYRTHRGVYYIRTTSGRRQASRQELLRLFQATESLFYDETAVLRADLADLSVDAFENFVRQAYQRSIQEFLGGYEQLLINLRLATNVEGVVYPNLAALLFFGREPQRFFPWVQVVAARIPGSDLKAAPSDAKTLGGTLPVMLEDAARFTRLHLQQAHHIRGFEPEVYPELPEEALRETLVNALAHRDYTVNAPIRLFIYDDRLEVRTPGGLPNTVTIGAIKLGAAHVLRNPTIYTLYSRLGMVTGIGSGVYRTIQLVREATGQEVGIYLEGNELVFSLPRRRLVFEPPEPA
ncbi:MAG: putative DNA binding domain-containing protein [Anaerolineae bacterium]